MEQFDLEKLIGELEIAVDRLRSLYDQYFLGIEKIEPGVVRKDVDRRFYALRKEQIRNTALRFRFQMVLQRYNTYQTHWQRVCREIENGTYKRHMMRAQRRFGSTRPPPAARASFRPGSVPLGAGDDEALKIRPPLAELAREVAPANFDIDVDIDASPYTPLELGLPLRPAVERPSPAATVPVRPPATVWKKVGVPVAPAALASQGAPIAPPAARAAAPPPPPRPYQPPAPAPASELAEDRLRQLYAELVETKRRQNESTAAITYQSVAKSIRESSDRLRKKHGKPVDFEVTVKDGKAVLRPFLK